MVGTCESMISLFPISLFPKKSCIFLPNPSTSIVVPSWIFWEVGAAFPFLSQTESIQQIPLGCKLDKKIGGRWWFQNTVMFYFHPLVLGEDFHSNELFFSPMGWFKHHLAKLRTEKMVAGPGFSPWQP